MFSKSKKSKEGKTKSPSKDGTSSQNSPSRNPFSSMSASLPKNIFSSGKSRKHSASSEVSSSEQISASPKAAFSSNGIESIQPAISAHTLGTSPGYYESLTNYTTGALPASSKSPFSSPSNTSVRSSGSSLASVKALKERYDRERERERDSSPASGSFMADRSFERHVDRLQMFGQTDSPSGSNPNVSGRDRFNISSDKMNSSMTSSYGRDRSLDREYPHMGARSLERDHHFTGRSRSSERPDFTTQLYNQEMRHFRDALILELQGQIADLNKECAKIQQELDSTKDKLSSSMNSIKTFWSPELKKERAMRKEESAKYSLLNEQLKVAQAELKKQSTTIRELEAQVSFGEDEQASSQISRQEIEILQREKDKQAKEILILRRTVDEMDLRISTQKQTLAARDESMKKLLEMLQNKGHSVKGMEENRAEIEQLLTQKLEDERKIKQLQNEVNQKESECSTLKEDGNRLLEELEQIKLQLKQQPASVHTMQAMLEAKDSRISALEKEVQGLEDRLLKSQGDGDSLKKDGSLKDSLSNKEKHLKAEIIDLKKEISNKDTELAGLKLKAETSEKQQTEHQQYITVLKDQITAKESHNTMLQAEIEEIRDRLKDKDSTIDRKAKHSHSLQTEKRKIETEISEMKEQVETKDRKIDVLQQRIDQLEEDVRNREKSISQLRTVQTNMESSAAMVTSLEESIVEKEKQIERLKEQRDKAESEHQEECELHIQKNQDLQNQLDKLKIELAEKQTELCELRETATEASSEKFQTDSKVRQLEREVEDKVAQLDKANTELAEMKKELEENKVATNSEDVEKQLSELTGQIDQARNETNKVQAEVDRLLTIMKDSENEKNEKDAQMKEMQETIKEYKQKMGTLKRSQQLEKKKNAHLLEEARKREGDLSEDASQLKDAVIAKGDRIEELEEALKESVRITAEREMVMADQQKQLEEAEQKADDLTMELVKMKTTLSDQTFKVTNMTKQLEEKDQKLKRLQSERHRHLEEVFEMKQEAIQAAICEKDANIALLEMTSTKQRKNTEEIDKLSKEKEKLHSQLKDVTQNRMRLIHKQERYAGSLGRNKKTMTERMKGTSPDRVDPYVLTAPSSLES
ncbi:hypothetical protein FSP39_008635 [Pinctada imbricata]|uniref:Uncharacterized protein n=1 Tax=Pinctada imbricata TaxID=66713 RepID=A0AA88YIH4_PINIB|nr:hypothetical protein FSP39_008635 [Pinctada imbricata]